MLLPDGTQAGHLAVSPNGRSLAIDVGGDRVEMVDVADGSAVTIYRVTPGTNARPEARRGPRTDGGCCSSRGSRARQGFP